MKNIVLFGKPGSGKGTQASLIEKKYNYIHISTGDVFRNNINQKTQLGLEAKKFIDSGDLVPDNLTIKMLEDKVENYKTPSGFIFDGFPRTKSQARALDEFLQTKKTKISLVIELFVDDKILIKWLIERGKSSGRTDDQNELKILNRLDNYNDKTFPLVEYYKKQKKFFSVNGESSVEDTFKKLCNIVDKF